MQNIRKNWKPLLAALLILITGAIVTSAIPGGADQARAGADQAANDATTIRIGRVVSFDAQNVSVLFTSGASYSIFDNIAYLTTYKPILGDYVMVQKYANQWIVMGPLSYNIAKNNAVRNPSFEGDPVGSNITPDGWGWLHDAGSSTANNVTYNTAAFVNGGYDGAHAAYVNVNDTSGVGNKASRDYFYSDVMAVTAGEQWTAAAGVSFDAGGSSGLVNASAQIQLWLLFYTSPLDAVTASIGSYFLDQAVQNSTTPGWFTMTLLDNTSTSGVTVPIGANYMRLAMISFVISSASANAYGSVYYDGMVARKLVNSDGTFVH